MVVFFPAKHTLCITMATYHSKKWACYFYYGSHEKIIKFTASYQQNGGHIGFLLTDMTSELYTQIPVPVICRF